MDKIKVIYILSYPRSGSTLLGNLLGKDSNGFHVGELERYWIHSNVDKIGGGKCGCGLPYFQCDFWGQIIEEIVPEVSFKIWLRKMYRKPHSFESNSRGYESISVELRNQLVRFYRLIQQRSGQEYIVDSSKSLPFLKLLLSIEDFDVKVIQLIRDSRAVVNSRLRKSIIRNKYNLSEFRKQILYLKEAYDWNAFYTHKLHRRLPSDSLITLKYEDFASGFPDYFNTVIRAKLAGWGLQLPAYQKAESLDLRSHAIRGNTSKYRADKVNISYDSRWRDELSPYHKSIIGFMTRKARKMYNYSQDKAIP